MTTRKNAAAAARKGFAAAMDELEAVIARNMRPGESEGAVFASASRPIEGAEAEDLARRVAALEQALSLAERERDAARAALTALRAARAEEARMVDEALRDLRRAV